MTTERKVLPSTFHTDPDNLIDSIESATNQVEHEDKVHKGLHSKSARLSTQSTLHAEKYAQLTKARRKAMTMRSLLGKRGDTIYKDQEHEKNAKGSRSQDLPFTERIAYSIDGYISTRPGQTVFLGIVGVVIVLLGGLFLKLVRLHERISKMIWVSWTYLSNPGSHVEEEAWELRTVGAIATLVGILYFSVVMGFVVDGIRAKMDSLKKGKSRVAERGHTLLLGWTDKSLSLIRQICLANESEHGGVVVVLAEGEKEKLEADLASNISKKELRGTKVVFRMGSPLLSVDLLKVSAHRAKSIIILANVTGDADRSDSTVLRTVLSLRTLPKLQGFIVAELRDIDNEPLVRLVGGEDVEILVSHDIVGRLILTAARSPGLARVFSCLLGFEGNEFYFKAWPECIHVQFGNLAERFPNAIPLGIKRANGDVLVFPPFTTTVKRGDEILVLAEDDDTYKACAPVEIYPGHAPDYIPHQHLQEKILVCGWRRDIRDMIALLDCLVEKGTELHMVCEQGPVKFRNRLLRQSGLDVDGLENLTLHHHYGNTAIRRHLEALDLNSFTSIMILADQSREDDIMHSDSYCLATLLLIRDLQARAAKEAKVDASSRELCQCISEILDPRTQRTISTNATILQLSEFIQSNELVSCILAMISESRDVRGLLDELLGSSGASFEVQNALYYCAPGEKVSFWQLSKRAMDSDEILCGYQQRNSIDITVLNPPDKDVQRTWDDTDLIVLRSKPVNEERPLPAAVSEFERKATSEYSEASMVRSGVLDALIAESEMLKTDFRQQSDAAFIQAKPSFHELSTAQEEYTMDDASIKKLIQTSRLLANALEERLEQPDSHQSGRRPSSSSYEQVESFM